eukprot:Lithocolla_globosa_v1_NODE_2951_length_1817_cov_6.949403.p3 type:complete len:122 gc:universal NODE_2951_length_1817_cov_6.949403:270-635(+)
MTLSGYHHVKLTQRSWKYMGFELEGYYFVCKVLPFGWKPSADIFNAISNAPLRYIRDKLKRPGQMFIDDGIGSGIRNPHGGCSTVCSANDSAYIVGRVFTRLGFSSNSENVISCLYLVVSI